MFLNEHFYTESLILVVDGARYGPLESRLKLNHRFRHFFSFQQNKGPLNIFLLRINTTQAISRPFSSFNLRSFLSLSFIDYAASLKKGTHILPILTSPPKLIILTLTYDYQPQPPDNCL